MALDFYGDAGLWCWIANDYPYEQLGLFYTVVLISWATCIFCLVEVERVEGLPLIVAGDQRKDDFQGSPRTVAARLQAAAAAQESTAAVRSRLLKYIVAFIFIWTFGLANRIQGAIAYEVGFDTVYALALLHVLFVPLQVSVFRVRGDAIAVIIRLPLLKCFRAGLLKHAHFLWLGRRSSRGLLLLDIEVLLEEASWRVSFRRRHSPTWTVFQRV